MENYKEKLNILLEANIKAGDVVHTPGGIGKVKSVSGSKVIVVMIDGPKVPQEYNVKDVRSEGFNELSSTIKESEKIVIIPPSGRPIRATIDKLEKGKDNLTYIWLK